MEENTTIKKNNAFFRQLIYLAVLIGIGVVLFKQLYFFVGSFLGAITIYVVIRNAMFYLVEKRRFRRWIAALLLVIATALALILFGWLSVKAIGPEISNISLKGVVNGVNHVIDLVNDGLGMHLVPDDIIQKSDGLLQKMATGILNTTYSFTANIFMMLIILYFMLTSGRKMEAKIWEYAPFKNQSLCMVKREAKTMIWSNAVGMPLILIAQTLTSALIYWLLGFSNFWFWGFLTALCGLIPIVGTTIVYIPVAIWLVAQGELWQGIVLALYGIIIISNTDNVFRIILLKKVADTHPLIVIFGVILGIPLFGFWGIIFGPLFISGFILLIRIYYMEYGLLEHPIDDEKCGPVRKQVPKHFAKIHERANAPRQPKAPNAEPAKK